MTDPDATGPQGGEERSRRRVLALFGALLLAFVGAGAGVSNRLTGDEATDGDQRVDLSVDYSVTPDSPAPTPTPTPPRGSGSTRPGSGGWPGLTGSTDGSESSADEPSPTPTPRPPDDDDDGSSAPAGGGGGGGAPLTPTATATPSSDLVASSIPPVSLDDLAPGDGGVVDLSLSLSGSSARLWVRGDATGFEEGDLLETEREAGDEGSPGELQEAVRVRLWYDADGDGTAGDADRVVYDGSLAGLGTLSDWVALTDGCVPPGTHTVRLRWDLPADAPNTVQTDRASFSLGVAADAGDC